MSKYIMILDTETTSLDKPFCYDLGYPIVNAETGDIVEQKHFVVEQTWHNLPLFESAYYKEKRQLYIPLMRSRKAKMDKWGYIMQEMTRDIKKYDITEVYAYNSPFDDNVIQFNCDWFKCINPLDNVAVYDIRGYASQFITNTEEYKAYCERHELFTETGNYSGTAESVYRFITGDSNFEEAHIGLYDAQIESGILMYCLDHGAELATEYKVTKSIVRPTVKPFTIKVNGTVVYTGEYLKKYNRNDVYNFTVKE